jgi:surface protein
MVTVATSVPLSSGVGGGEAPLLEGQSLPPEPRTPVQENEPQSEQELAQENGDDHMSTNTADVVPEISGVLPCVVDESAAHKSAQQSEAADVTSSNGAESPPLESSPLKRRDSMEFLHRGSSAGLLVGAIRVQQTTTVSAPAPIASSSIISINSTSSAPLTPPDRLDVLGYGAPTEIENANSVWAYLVEPEESPNPPAEQPSVEGSVPWKTLAVLTGVLVILVGAVLGGLCGLGSCPVRNKDRTGSNRKRIDSTVALYEAVDRYFALKREAFFKNHSAALYEANSMALWDVSRVSNFDRVFDPHRNLPFSGNRSNATSTEIWLDTEDLSGWDMSSATTLFGAFASAFNFNGDISQWNVSSVTNMSDVFQGATKFAGDVSRWNVSKVQSMARMFQNAATFESDVSAWDVSNVVSTRQMFDGAYRFSSDLSQWNVSTVQDFSFMFRAALIFDADLSQWNVSKAVTMEGTFNLAFMFSSDLSSWDVSNVANMQGMFADAAQFSSNLSSWNVSSVKDISRMFAGATSLNENLCNWGTLLSAGAMAEDVFLDSGCPAMSKLVIPFGPFCFECAISKSTKAFETTEELYQAVDAYLASPGNPRSPVALTYGYPIGIWNVGKITDFSCLFDPDRRLEYQENREYRTISSFDEDLAEWNMSSAVTLAAMFIDASRFNGNITTWNTSSVTDMRAMFNRATNFAGDLSHWDVSRVTTMRRMFYKCEKFNSDLSAWNVGSVRDMFDLFNGAASFASDLSRWNVSSVDNMQGIFYDASAFNSDLSLWDVSNVRIMNKMFMNARMFTSNLSAWNVSRAMTLSEMFLSTSSFDSDLSLWDVGNADLTDTMFSHAHEECVQGQGYGSHV